MISFFVVVDITTLTTSGLCRGKIQRFSLATSSGQINTMWAPLSMSVKIFIGNSTAGPSIRQFQM